jgi:hypothetical protein
MALARCNLYQLNVTGVQAGFPSDVNTWNGQRPEVIPCRPGKFDQFNGSTPTSQYGKTVHVLRLGNGNMARIQKLPDLCQRRRAGSAVTALGSRPIAE